MQITYTFIHRRDKLLKVFFMANELYFERNSKLCGANTNCVLNITLSVTLYLIQFLYFCLFSSRVTCCLFDLLVPYLTDSGSRYLCSSCIQISLYISYNRFKYLSISHLSLNCSLPHLL